MVFVYLSLKSLNRMKKVEIALFILIIVAFAMKLMHLPYNSILITFACVMLSILYMFFGFALLNGIKLRAMFKTESYKAISILRILAGITLGFVLSTVVVYSLFKVQFWPFGNQGLLMSLVLYGMAVLTIAIFYFLKRRDFFKINRIRLVLIGLISITIYSLSYNSLVDMYYSDRPKYAKAYKDYLNHPGDPYYMKLLDEAAQEEHE